VPRVDTTDVQVHSRVTKVAVFWVMKPYSDVIGC
jgi:hypothetical protein